LIFRFVLEYSIKRVQVNQGDLKLSGKHLMLVYADDVNTVGGNIHTIQKNTAAVEVASREIDRKVNAEETQYSTFFSYCTSTA
jgi:hypothetical protein